MSIVYLSIGSNLGNKKENCLRAIELLEKKGIKIRKKSSLYETKPWGIKNQPLFLNMAIEIETDLQPEKLLKLLKDIEIKLGRKRTIKWGPRIIDLDILLFNDIIVDKKDLKIPHPLMHKRDFVLKPLSEIAPEIYHPLLKCRIDELLQQCACE